MDAVAASIDHPRSRPLEIVDAGSGTGHYLAHLLSRGPDRRGLALDASSVAVAMSVATAHSPGLVADTWKLLPVRTDRADAILCVFAPRNASEFARILRPTGSLVVVTPGPRHLTELRESGVVIGMQENKQDALARGLGEHFQCTDRTALEYSVHISAEDGDDLASMGPSGHHERSGAWIGGSVSVDVDVTIWALREPS